ncbi:MAG: hypothetical protein A3I33_00775 [Candidatus Colwellbacteria bacterium RIFCSPLOWO2_02_FULL_45_11]|uniref:M23ase beta-sheet core domain-containing protein n=1 Tax=Candidatus Colwellbacteria bacterium RIFCSPLOWO2_02_FULL_45_11 TaxID=1797692 RepID=A0A1G1ZAC2_9BACT|nr:MAG: hypothetical protein A3I33_00775 [Candidatus Colwellbacteria bacterium RIFCSPLOWO2_02_FULL_45_11]
MGRHLFIALLVVVSFLALSHDIVFIENANAQGSSATGSVELDLPERAARLYDWSIGVGTILALGILVYAGFLYTTSAGNSSRITEAKRWITAALTGLLILLSSYLILNTINPDLTNLEAIALRLDERITPSEGKIVIRGGAYFAPALQQFCYEGCISGGGTIESCEGLPACPDEACPLGLRKPGLSSKGVWLSCRPGNGPIPGLSGAICPWNQGGCTSDHSGIDLGAPMNVPVYALESGVVTSISYDDVCGNFLNLRGDSGQEYGYCHLAGYVDKIHDLPAHVVAGEQIAFNGKSGNARGPHIHFNMYRSDCGENTCEILPGCYALGQRKKRNPGPKIEEVCGVDVPATPTGEITGGATRCEDAGGFCTTQTTCARLRGTVMENLCSGGQDDKCCVDTGIQ